MESRNDLNLTNHAREALEAMDENPLFKDPKGAVELIYQEVKARIPMFHLYLKRYINDTEGISWDEERPAEFYSDHIQRRFLNTGTPVSFDPNSTTRPKAAIRNWLTRRTVSRKTVLLLGLGLGMKPGAVNALLTKGICEQAINPKDPFEVMCYYCYKFGKNYVFFEALMDRYEQLPSVTPQWGISSADATVGFRNSMHGIETPDDLFTYLATLKSGTNIPRISRTATRKFVELHHTLVERIAFEEKSSSDRVSDQKVQDLIYTGVPKSEGYNLVPEKDSDLYEVFSAKRLNRQRIGKLKEGKEEVTRYDLITLNFAIHALEDELPRLERYRRFMESTNQILQDCFLEELIIQNPYEYFVIACMLTPNPIEPYWDVWERSFD